MSKPIVEGGQREIKGRGKGRKDGGRDGERQREKEGKRTD